jgi:hypothetical protein
MTRKQALKHHRFPGAVILFCGALVLQISVILSRCPSYAGRTWRDRGLLEVLSDEL